MSHHINRVRIKAVANALGELKDKVVFVGGATISLYPTHAALEVRPTDDIDVIIEVINYAERAAFENRLRDIGFVNDVQSGIICRWRLQGILLDEITVDIMPTDDESIGFGNKWYPEGFRTSVDYTIDEGCTVKILSAAYFIATKLEAFKGRGKGDGRQSHDFEDIIYLLENRYTIWDEINNANDNLRNYLKAEFANLLNNRNLLEWIDSHVERLSPPATYLIYDEIQKLATG